MAKTNLLSCILILLMFSLNLPTGGNAKTRQPHICPYKSIPCCCKVKATGKICVMGMISQKKSNASVPLNTTLIINARCGASSEKTFLSSNDRLFILPKREQLTLSNYFCYLDDEVDRRLKELFLAPPKKPPRILI